VKRALPEVSARRIWAVAEEVVDFVAFFEGTKRSLRGPVPHGRGDRRW
jgi:hypothetical protein